MGTTRSESSVRAGRDDGDRHGWIDTYVGRLQRVRWGREAQAWIVGERGALPRRGAVVCLPAWAWMQPSIRMGRKAVPDSGRGKLVMPVPVTWSSDLLLVPATRSATDVQWKAMGMGRSSLGITTISVDTASATTGELLDAGSGLPADTVHRRPVTGSELRRQLRAIAEDGEKAHWELLEMLAPKVQRSARKAVKVFQYEVARLPRNLLADGAVDPTTVSLVETRMLYGENDSDPTRAAVWRLIERSLKPHQFRNTDPLRYVRLSLDRDAAEELRRTIGDPRIGPRVRRVYGDVRPGSVAELVDAYNERHRSDRLGVRRALASLLVARDPNAGLSMDDPDVGTVLTIQTAFHQGDVADEVLARLGEDGGEAA